jgi:hypothetical protein
MHRLSAYLAKEKGDDKFKNAAIAAGNWIRNANKRADGWCSTPYMAMTASARARALSTRELLSPRSENRQLIGASGTTLASTSRAWLLFTL